MSRDDTSDAWIREALASLDRPQMPDDVAQRLDEALHRAQLSDSEHSAAATIIPQQRAGRQAGSAKRRSWLIGAAGIAAALVAVAVVNPLQLGVGDTPDSTEFAAPQVSGPASEPPDARPAPTPTLRLYPSAAGGSTRHGVAGGEPRGGALGGNRRLHETALGTKRRASHPRSTTSTRPVRY